MIVIGVHFTQKMGRVVCQEGTNRHETIRVNSCLLGIYEKSKLYLAGAGVGNAGPAAGLAPFVKSISSISNCNTELPGIGP